MVSNWLRPNRGNSGSYRGATRMSQPRRGGARIVQADGAAGHRLRPGKHRLPPGVEPQTGFGPAQQGREGRIRGGQGVILGRHGHNCFQIYSF